MESQGSPFYPYNPSLRTAFQEGKGGCPTVSDKGTLRAKRASGREMTALWGLRPPGASGLTQGRISTHLLRKV